MVEIDDLFEGWREALAGVQSGRPVAVLRLFVENPFWTAGGIADKLGVAYTTARRAIDRLEAAGIVSQNGTAKRNRVYCAREMLEVLDAPQSAGRRASRKAVQGRPGGGRRHRDLDRGRRRLQADRVVAGRRSRKRIRDRLHGGPAGPARQPRPAHHGRPQGLPGGRRGRLRSRCGLRHAGEAVWRSPGRREALQPRDAQAPHRGQPRFQRRQHLLRRAADPRHADADVPLHAADQCVLQEVREPHAHGRALHPLVQLHPHPQDAARHPRHGSRSERDRAGHGRPGADHGRAGAEARPARSLCPYRKR